MINNKPGYLNLLTSGELYRRVQEAKISLGNCKICPLSCGKNRLHGERGKCRTGENAKISSYGPHFGEEFPISGTRGSGTVFITNCNLQCQFCQNYEISQLNSGYEVTIEELSNILLKLQDFGCHNINFVSPSHIVPQILEGVHIAAQKGLIIPLVYNTGGYDSVKTLKLLDGIFDIYMPDMKYGDTENGLIYSKVPNYPQINQAAIKEMYHQVGNLETNKEGIAYRGLLVRHLLLPENIAGTEIVIKFLAEEISTKTYLNLMDQYYPSFNSKDIPKLNKRITNKEFIWAKNTALKYGLNNLDNKVRFK